MFQNSSLFLFLSLLLWSACETPAPAGGTLLQSPGAVNTIAFQLTERGAPSYRVLHGTETIIEDSQLGFELQGQAPLAEGFEVVTSEQNSFDETWEMPWGEQRTVRNHYNELVVELRESAPP
ncbi:MAG: glycoside hydrolase family 97 N-terminal domain-containing protein, partial [Bacteroidota bacterium]